MFFVRNIVYHISKPCSKIRILKPSFFQLKFETRVNAEKQCILPALQHGEYRQHEQQYKRSFIHFRFREIECILSRLRAGRADNCSTPIEYGLVIGCGLIVVGHGHVVIRGGLVVIGTVDGTSSFEKLEMAPNAEHQHDLIVLMLQKGEQQI